MNSKSDSKDGFNILELYSGIGGFHFALKPLLQSRKYNLTAIDINTSANWVYQLNHLKENLPDESQVELLQRNIEMFSVKEFDRMNLTLLTMSPPCQPFCRLGNQKDLVDSRCSSFLYLINTLPSIQKKPKFIFVENVKGFETSKAHDLLIKSLNDSNYVFKEFLLTPKQFSIPNARQRYYLMGKHCPNNFQNQHSKILTQIPVLCDNSVSIFDSNIDDIKYCDNIFIDPTTGNVVEKMILPKIENYLESLDSKEVLEKYYLKDEQLIRYHMIIDIVEPESTSTNCFTRSYGHRLEGSGSILKTSNEHSIKDIYEQINTIKDQTLIIELLKKLKLRFFTPKEIANLMCFPDSLVFPNGFTNEQCYRLLGNSINVFVCRYLLKILLGTEIFKST